ncbi:MAG: hypothetical protein JSV52_03970 [Candidatus Zixiibacteriota bacterium]|nr:MAG: hypothetical protein JSV52_03970 [candidate division Zixibacteria bacterium]
MKQSRYRISLPLVVVGAVLIVLLVTCDKDSQRNLAGPDGQIAGGYDPVFSAGGGFVITYGMLDRRFNEITFPGTHNSYASNWEPHCENQHLSIADQLEYGIRYIEFDIDVDLYVNHGGFCAGYMNERLQEIKHYVMEHPLQIFTVRIADLSCKETILIDCLIDPPTPEYAYAEMNAKLIEQGLDKYIYNWHPEKLNDDPLKCYIPDPWPTLREMIESGKNVMFIHNRDYKEHGVIDEAYVLKLDYSFPGSVCDYKADEQEQFCRLMPSWSPTRDRQKDGPYRLFLIECCPDGVSWAGDQEDAAKNNDGRRLYQVAKQHEMEILPDNRVVNYINVDYYRASNAGPLPIDVVDACNRLNHERVGSDWEHSECFWELYPHEFDDSRVEHLSQIPAIQAEVAEVVAGFKAKLDLDGHEDKGKIVSTTYETDYDWKRLPEWAVDNDLWTRWCGSCWILDHTWGIDLGERKAISEIAIAWEFSHKRPGYRVYASNDDFRFGDGISNEELREDAGWLEVAEGDRQTNVSPQLWDIKTFRGGQSDWRYVKIKVYDTRDEEHWPSFWEVKLYGPAN